MADAAQKTDPSMAPSGPATPPAAQPQAPADLSPLELKVFLCHVLGWPAWRVALNCGIAEGTVRAILARPRFQAAMAAARQEIIAHGSAVMMRIQELAAPAVETIADLMVHGKNEGVKMRSAMDILDRAGYKPVERSESVNTHRSVAFNLHALAPEEREAFRLLAAKAARANLLGSTPADPQVDKEVEL